MKYKIIVNGEPKSRSHAYEFDYGSIKRIKLRLTKGRLSVEAETGVKKSADQFFTEKNNYFSEALKKGMLFHLLLYSEPLSTHNIRIFINDEEVSDWNPERSPVIYSLISKKLEPALSKEWQGADAVFQYFCKNHKTQQENLAASLYALLYSKAKDSETERFQYLWMSMNGLYTHLATLKYPGKKSPGEGEKIRVLEEVEEWGNGSVSRAKPEGEKEEDQHKMVRLIGNVLKEPNFERPDIEELLEGELKTFHPKDGRKGINLNGYLNLWYPYYLRCNMFHANQPISLFALKKEIEIRRLEFINKRLDSYLDNNLWKYFDQGYCKEKIDNISRKDEK